MYQGSCSRVVDGRYTRCLGGLESAFFGCHCYMLFWEVADVDAAPFLLLGNHHIG